MWSPCSTMKSGPCNYRKPTCRNEDPAQQKKKNFFFFKEEENLDQWHSTGSNFTSSSPTPGGIWQCLPAFLVVITGEGKFYGFLEASDSPTHSSSDTSVEKPWLRWMLYCGSLGSPFLPPSKQYLCFHSYILHGAVRCGLLYSHAHVFPPWDSIQLTLDTGTLRLFHHSFTDSALVYSMES